MVPEDALLGDPGNGFGIAMESLTNGRLGVSAASVGATNRVNAMPVAQAKQRARGIRASRSGRGCTRSPTSGSATATGGCT